MMKKVAIVLALLLFYGCVLLYYYPPLDDLFGYKEFNDPESKDEPEFYVSLIFVIFFAGLLLFFVKKNGWKQSMHYAFVLLIITILFSINATEFLNKANYYRAFDEEEWNKTTDKKPLLMARWLEKNAFGMGWSAKEVIQNIGDAYDTTLFPEHTVIRYQTEHPSGYLDYVLENGKVIKVNMWCECD
jgi:hypothetical protein